MIFILTSRVSLDFLFDSHFLKLCFAVILKDINRHGLQNTVLKPYFSLDFVLSLPMPLALLTVNSGIVIQKIWEGLYNHFQINVTGLIISNYDMRESNYDMNYDMIYDMKKMKL